MVADGFERCPACGSRMQPRIMDDKTGFTWKDFFNYSWVTIFFAIVAFLVPIGLVLLCLLLYL
jgi:hypothetical protein